VAIGELVNMDEKEWKKLGLHPLSAQALDILSLLANGFAPVDIVTYRAQYSYDDIKQAAREALAISGRIKKIGGDTRDNSTAKKGNPSKSAKYPRAGAAWTEREEQNLVAWYKAHVSTTEIARRFQRRRSAVLVKLYKMGIIPADYTPRLQRQIEEIESNERHDR
jgi:hypothetical protein